MNKDDSSNSLESRKESSTEADNYEPLMQNGRYQVVLDMETDFLDDFITLLFLLGHPLVNLKAVTVFPGTPDQIGLIRHVTSLLGRADLPLGAFDVRAQTRLHRFYSKLYDMTAIRHETNVSNGAEVLLSNCDEQTILICGGPLSSVGEAIKTGKLKVGRLVVQGGFAGDNVVPKAKRMKKFEGLITASVCNLDRDVPAVLALLRYENIQQKFFVSKNVCHRVNYTTHIHERLGQVADRSPTLKEIHRIMTICRKSPDVPGKGLHDPLAACCAIDPSIGEWRDVELYFDSNQREWGSKIVQNPNIKIIIDYNSSKFKDTLLAYPQ